MTPYVQLRSEPLIASGQSSTGTDRCQDNDVLTTNILNYR